MTWSRQYSLFLFGKLDGQLRGKGIRVNIKPPINIIYKIVFYVFLRFGGETKNIFIQSKGFNMRLLILGFIAIISLVGCREGAAKDQSLEKLYKANTVDECIQEKECVWHAFINQIYESSYATNVLMRNHLSRWEGNIRSRVGGNKAKEYIDKYIKFSKDLTPYISSKIDVDFLNSNYIIIFTDAFDQEVNNLLVSLEENKISSKVKNSIKNKTYKNNECLTVNLSSKNGESIIHSVSIINVISTDFDRCLAASIYSSFGMTGEIKNQDFSYFNEVRSDKSFTKLDKFLIFLLYQKEFKSGQNFKEVGKIFNKNFKTYQNNFFEVEKD